MKKFVRLICLTIVIILLICSNSFAKSTKFINGIAQIDGYLRNNELIKIIVSTSKYTSNYPYNGGLMWGADEYEKPRFVITDVKVLIGTTKLFVPLSAFCDLADPSKITLNINNNSFSLIIYGGDAGGSYMAEIVFGKQEIKSRKVTHGEFPDETWEKTEYSFVQDRGQ
jgi:hypothetical protein